VWLTSNDLITMKQYSSLVGRLLLLSQKYEFTCKEMVKWLELVSKLEEEKLGFMNEEYLSYVDKLNGLLLGESLKTLKGTQKLFRISNNEISILHNGRKSRNWIAHQIGENIIFNSKFSKEDIEKCESHVIHLGKADFMVSKWSYEFHEKEPNNYIGEENYIKMICKWVFE
jgi:hypothetical protein